MSKYMLFLAAIAAGVLVCVLAATTDAAARPNIVIMLSDDQRWDAVGSVQRKTQGRFPFFKSSTPNIDRIAAAGVWFNNAFAAESLCSPSRAAFLTGKYNHTNGIVNNTTELPTATQTYATLLRAAGYHTGYFGKWHMGQQRARPGFDEYASFVGQGQYFDCPLIVNGVNTPTTGWVDDVTTDYAVNFIQRSANQENPFLMIIGFKTPHGPWTPPDRTKQLFSTKEIDTPSNATSYPPYFVGPKPSTFGGKSFRDYFRAVAGMDQDVGRILDALGAAGIAGNTFVVFASDNGWQMREHGAPSPVQTDGEKRSAYDASIRIPLFVRYPPLTAGGQRSGAAVQNIDLAPTLLEIAGLPPRLDMQGKSWVPLLNGTATAVRSGIFYEYFREQGFIVPRIIAFRQNGLKIIEYPDHPEYGKEFYDLSTDPWETNNRIDDPTVQSQVQSMSLGLTNATKKFGYQIPPRAGPQD